jgi:integrase
MMRLKHLPLAQWPEADRAAFEAAYAPGGIFDDARGPGSHLAEGTRRMTRTVYRRWLSFLRERHPGDLLLAPLERITPVRVRTFIEHLSQEVKPTTLAIACDNLLYAARLFGPHRDWSWLKVLKVRLHAQARPEDRFLHLVPAWQTLDLGIRLMNTAVRRKDTQHMAREILFRDGLLIAVLSCWPIRRRSISALTVSRHLEFIDGGLYLILHAEDTKSKRSESCRMPDELVPYVQRYLNEVRPRLLRGRSHDALWASYRGRPLVAGRIYDMVRRETSKAFGKPMSLHDFRRAGATFLATIAPDQVGLIPALLQHASPEVSERHYNLARSVEASRRFAGHLAQTRDKLRLFGHFQRG